MVGRAGGALISGGGRSDRDDPSDARCDPDDTPGERERITCAERGGHKEYPGQGEAREAHEFDTFHERAPSVTRVLCQCDRCQSRPSWTTVTCHDGRAVEACDMAEDVRHCHVVLVNGSPRHGTTLEYLRQVERILQDAGVSTDLIPLAGTEIRDCSGCETCIRRTGWCVQPDSAPEILHRMLSADGLVIATPVYMGTVTGKLKSLLDKTASWLHRPPAVGIPVLPLVTTAGSGAKQTLLYLTETVASWAAHPVAGIARSASARGPVEHREVKRFLDHLRRSRSTYRPTWRQVVLFQVQRVLAAKVAEIDRRYWEERGWDRSGFYYPCRMGPGKRVVGALFYRILYRRIRPSSTF